MALIKSLGKPLWMYQKMPLHTPEGVGEGK